MTEANADLCPRCQSTLTPDERGHTMCRACAEKDMVARLRPVLFLPSSWYDDDDVRSDND